MNCPVAAQITLARNLHAVGAALHAVLVVLHAVLPAVLHAVVLHAAHRESTQVQRTEPAICGCCVVM